MPDQAGEALKDRFLELESASLGHFRKYLVRRWGNFREVGRFALTWLIAVTVIAMLVVQQTDALSNSYTTQVPAAGGVYTEGLSGKAENFNPLFVSSQAESAVSHLIFSGLLKYDAQNNLVGDLARSWSADESGRVYTVTLRDNLRWHDGVAITADDVIYTVKTIQDDSTRSPLASSWKGVEVKALNSVTVQFTLPTAFPPFPYSLTSGIIPKHKLEDTPDFRLRTANFNVAPTVGSGPFIFRENRSFNGHQEIRLDRNDDYHGTNAKPERFVIFAYESDEALVAAFKNHEISAAGGLPVAATKELSESDKDSAVVESSPLLHETLAFFKTSQPQLQDVKIRAALTAATDKNRLMSVMGNVYKQANLPLLPGQLGYAPDLDKHTYNLTRAKELLDEAGWKLDKDGIRKKDGQKMELTLAASTNDEYPAVAAELQRQWQQLGISIKPNLIKPSDFQQNVILPHNYDILLYEISLGKDPDVFAYWDSSQAGDRGLNLSEYRSQRVDDALRSGRTRTNPDLRTAKYRAFLDQWLADSPAVALYQPSYGYAYRNSVSGYQNHVLVDSTGRFFNITDWTANSQKAAITH